MNAKTCILHIDDDKTITRIAREILSFAGYEVDSFNDPAEIPETKFDWKKYSLLIIDWMLPNENAIQLYDRAKDNGYNGPAVVLSAKTVTTGEKILLSERGLFFMKKPFGPSSLISTVTDILAK